MDSIIEVITIVRNLRNKENIPNSTKLKIKVFDKSEDSHLVKIFNENMNYLIKFTNAESFEVSSNKDFKGNGSVSAIKDGELFILLDGAIDCEKEIEKLEKELLKVQAGIDRGNAMFDNPNFVSRAPQFKIDAERKILDDYLSRKETILKRIEQLKLLRK